MNIKCCAPAFFCGALVMLFSANSQAQPFIEVEMGMHGICCGTIAWGDYDNDGDLDLFASGISEGAFMARIYRNDGNQFTDIEVELPGVYEGSAAWGDYDNDGDLDLVVTGELENAQQIARIYRNDEGSFSDVDASLTGAVFTSLDWGDYDNDGDLDLVINGRDNLFTENTWLYRNDQNVFTEVSTQIQGADLGSVNWIDYDNDGDLDLLVTGRYLGPTDGFPPRTQLYQNQNTTYIDHEANLIAVQESTSAWGDYDHDGDLDLVVAGKSEEDDGTVFRVTRLYENEGGTFTYMPSEIIDASMGSAAWGDYDHDGDLDLVVTGIANSGEGISFLYRNEDGVFTKVDQEFPGVATGQAIWGDYDNDGDLDLLIAGDDLEGSTIMKLYRNDRPHPNQPPAAPTNLSVLELEARTAMFCWDAATDDTTPQQALSYNLRVGTDPNGSHVMSSMSLLGGVQDGQRLVVNYGNVGQKTCARLNGLTPNTTYYARVHAIDHSFSGSPFSEELSFTTATNVSTEDVADFPNSIQLDAIYPNPSSASIMMQYTLPQTAHVSLVVYDLLGREVARLVDRQMGAGAHHTTWDGSSLPSGTYLFRLTAGNFTRAKNIVLSR